MRVSGLCIKKVVVRFKGHESGSRAVTTKVVRLEGVDFESLMLEVRRRPWWVLQVMRGRSIRFEKKFKTRREATTVARRLALGPVDDGLHLTRGR